MAYHDLTTNDQIRALLTIEDDELPDEILDAYGFEDDLADALDVAVPTWPAIVASLEPADARKQRRLRLFAKYFCAGTIAGMAQVFMLKSKTDGSNKADRSDKDGWEFIALALLNKAQGYIALITDELGTTPVTPVFSMIARVVPDRDVITTPRAVGNAS
jgi:hypothetical protein